MHSGWLTEENAAVSFIFVSEKMHVYTPQGNLLACSKYTIVQDIVQGIIVGMLVSSAFHVTNV